MKTENLTNQEARAYAITVYKIYKKRPEYAKDLIFNSEVFLYPPDLILTNQDKSYQYNNIAWISFKVKLSVGDGYYLDERLHLPKLSEVEDKEITNPAIKDYAELIEKVASIDQEAAAYLLFEAYKLDSFKFKKSLLLCFVWATAPQGAKYWQRIYQILEKSN